MVKADLTRDYYGDLEIAPTADVAEIKKQFKKLGMANLILPFLDERQLMSRSQRLHTIRIEIQDAKAKSQPNSKGYNQHTKSSQILLSEQSTMQTELGYLRAHSGLPMLDLLVFEETLGQM
jgi:hypothetical protein